MRLPLTFVAALTFSLSGLVFAEQVRVPVGEQNDLAGLVKPERGMSARTVEAEFGEPESRHGPIGSPAIYFWEYEKFTVYFEDSYVIHSVSKIKSNTPYTR